MSYTSGVTSSPLLQTLMSQADAVGQGKTVRTDVTGTHKAHDSAHLSTAASALQQTGVEDTARSERVSLIQAAVANGTYTVSADAVADKLLQTMLQR